MTKLADFRVTREHQGDRITDDGTEVHRFAVGDTRTAHPATVAHLVKSGVLVAVDGEKSEDAPPENKAEGDSAENKGEGGAPEGRNNRRRQN